MKQSPQKRSSFGTYLRSARQQAGLTQAQLARRVGVDRTNIIRFEEGQIVPKWDRIVQLAVALGIPLQWFLTGSRRLPRTVAGITHELRHYGITDLAVDSTEPLPGAFRRLEELLVLAVRGKEPPVRILLAIPIILARHRIDAGLVIAHANLIERRTKVRLAWLADVTVILARQKKVESSDDCLAGLDELRERVRPPRESDGLGSATTKPLPPAWNRWKITFSGRLEDFVERIEEVQRHDSD